MRLFPRGLTVEQGDLRCHDSTRRNVRGTAEAYLVSGEVAYEVGELEIHGAQGEEARSRKKGSANAINDLSVVNGHCCVEAEAQLHDDEAPLRIGDGPFVGVIPEG